MTHATQTQTTEAYIVYLPGRRGAEIIGLVTDNKEHAIRYAQARRAQFEQKGWLKWASAVRIAKPNKPAVMQELAHQLVAKANIFGHVSKDDLGVHYSVDQGDLYRWADILYFASLA